MKREKRGVTRVVERIPSTVGRKRVGEVISVCLTDEQKAWIDAQIPAGGSRAQVIRAVIQRAMEG